MKRVLIRLLWSTAIACVLWAGATELLLEALLPPTIPGEDDLGAGMVAVAIGAGTLQVALILLALFNVSRGLRDRRIAR